MRLEDHTKLILIYSEHFWKNVKNTKESIQEGTACYTTPIFTNKSITGTTAMRFVIILLAAEVPFNCISWHHEIDWIIN